LDESGTGSSGYAFAGEQYDGYTQFVYLRARWLDTESGRFLSQDTWSGSIHQPATLHKYLFTLDNPVNLIDPSGKLPVPIVLPGAAKSAYMTYVSSDGGYFGQLTLHIKTQYYFFNPCSGFSLPPVSHHSWGARSGDPSRGYDPIEPNTYIVDPLMRRRNDSPGRGICVFGWCPLGRKWNEDAWGKERLSLKHESGQGSVYFIHGGNESRGSAGCIKVVNDDLKEILDTIQSVRKSFRLYIEKDYSTPAPPPDWHEEVIWA
jgi:RHS repeat-associated protein